MPTEVPGTAPTPVWCVIANVVTFRPYGEVPEEEGGLGRARGLRIFAGGAKVYVLGQFSGDGGERVKVIGRARGGGRFVEAIVPRKWLADWRVKLVYDPAALRRIAASSSHHEGTGTTEEDRLDCESWARNHEHWARRERAEDPRWVAGGFEEPDPV
ncbi:hypothetical protein Afil01_59270 [Actinorhabdospora filicis]|uniref:Uncharacterized protein n=1 Tax=Actinorhabdospora filicis TaxID=1785913 RepID=A0A9W6SSG2_9ACTN|nr:hypothetical protein [Actinorhabdospora filicis]GLZ81120.1 hypothetical protein Afil01_59270 [Actinorhabdospora filicis]